MYVPTWFRPQPGQWRSWPESMAVVPRACHGSMIHSRKRNQLCCSASEHGTDIWCGLDELRSNTMKRDRQAVASKPIRWIEKILILGCFYLYSLCIVCFCFSQPSYRWETQSIQTLELVFLFDAFAPFETLGEVTSLLQLFYECFTKYFKYPSCSSINFPASLSYALNEERVILFSFYWKLASRVPHS